MSFKNPYNFVAIDNVVERSNIDNTTLHNKMQKNTYAGILKCTLKTLTKIFTPSTLPEDVEEKIIGKYEDGTPKIHYKYKSFYYFRRGNQEKYAIPGASLKGVFRSVAEAISNSCMHVFDGKYNKISYKINDELQKDGCIFISEQGSLAKGICICCSMFGMANAKKADESEDKLFPNVFKSKISFSDALLLSDPSFEQMFPLKELSSPKPYHKNFYKDGESVKGRKFYYHHSDHDVNELKDREETNRNRSVTPLKKGASFEFTISFENLTEKEYGLLLTALELEPGLAHKIGMGKPLGLGSCTIDVIEIREFSKNRYLSIADEKDCKPSKDDIINRKKKIKGWWEKGIPSDLRCILGLNNVSAEIRYPKKDMRDRSKDEFSIYKNLHPPCQGFSDAEKIGEDIVFHVPQKKAGESHKKKSGKANGTMAYAFKKAMENKEEK